MIFWTGVCWACTKCGSAFGWRCPVCKATPENTEHDTKICGCPKCKKTPKEAKDEQI